MNANQAIKVQMALSKLGQKSWPALERKLQTEQADRVIKYLTAYAEATAAAEEAAKSGVAKEYHAACAKWRKSTILFVRVLQA